MREDEWCVEFWDFGAWNELVDTRRRLKKQCIEIAAELNRNTDHTTRLEVYEGHRFRVRKVKP